MSQSVTFHGHEFLRLGEKIGEFRWIVPNVQSMRFKGTTGAMLFLNHESGATFPLSPDRDKVMLDPFWPWGNDGHAHYSIEVSPR